MVENRVIPEEIRYPEIVTFSGMSDLFWKSWGDSEGKELAEI
jgi:hypothetical protein